MKYFVRSFLCLSLISSVLLAGSSVLAAGVTDTIGGGITKVAGNYQGSSTNLESVVGQIINVFLSIVGSLLLIYLIYAGFLWMTAEGESKRVDKARDIIKQALIGLVIIVAAYAISSYVLSRLATVTTGATPVAPGQPSPGN